MVGTIRLVPETRPSAALNRIERWEKYYKIPAILFITKCQISSIPNNFLFPHYAKKACEEKKNPKNLLTQTELGQSAIFLFCQCTNSTLPKCFRYCNCWPIDARREGLKIWCKNSRRQNFANTLKFITYYQIKLMLSWHLACHCPIFVNSCTRLSFHQLTTLWTQHTQHY